MRPSLASASASSGTGKSKPLFIVQGAKLASKPVPWRALGMVYGVAAAQEKLCHNRKGKRALHEGGGYVLRTRMRAEARLSLRPLAQQTP